MSRFRMLWRIVACSAALAVVASACGETGLTRDEAISSLQIAGVSQAEATCMADRLLAQNQLDAADPRGATSAESRESLLLANSECVSVEVLPEVELVVETTIPNSGANRPGGDEDESTPPAELGLDNPELLELQRQSGISRLMSFGRSVHNATCIVDQLLAVEAAYVLETEQFGLGLDANEAAAFAACM